MATKKTPSKILTFIFLITLPLFMTGCEASNLPLIGRFFAPSEPEAITLNYWGLFEPEGVMEQVIADYQEQHPTVTINYSQRPQATLKDYKDTVVTRLGQKSGDLPDIMRIHATWVAPLASLLAPSTSISEVEFNEQFYSVAAQTCVVSGQVMAAPLEYDGLILFYNKDIFQAENISKPPATWDEFQSLAVTLTKAEGQNITQSGAAVGLADSIPHASDIFGLMLSQTQASIPEDLDSPAAAAALNFYVRFYKEGKIWNERLINSLQAFADGKVAMIFAPSWRVFELLGINPTLQFATAPVPQAPASSEGELTNINWASFWVEAVPKTSPHPDAAWDFLRYLTTPEVQRKIYSEQTKIRPFGEPPSLKALRDEVSSEAVLHPLLQGAALAKTHLIVDASGNDPYAEAINAAIEAVAKGGDATTALETAKKTLVQLLGSR